MTDTFAQGLNKFRVATPRWQPHKSIAERIPNNEQAWKAKRQEHGLATENQLIAMLGAIIGCRPTDEFNRKMMKIVSNWHPILSIATILVDSHLEGNKQPFYNAISKIFPGISETTSLAYKRTVLQMVEWTETKEIEQWHPIIHEALHFHGESRPYTSVAKMPTNLVALPITVFRNIKRDDFMAVFSKRPPNVDALGPFCILFLIRHKRPEIR